MFSFFFISRKEYQVICWQGHFLSLRMQCKWLWCADLFWSVLRCLWGYRATSGSKHLVDKRLVRRCETKICNTLGHVMETEIRLFYQTTHNQFNFLVLYISKFRQILSYDYLEMMERYEDSKTVSGCPYPGKWNHPGFVNISLTVVIDTSMERSPRVLHHGNPRIWFSAQKRSKTYILICFWGAQITLASSIH